MRTVTVTGQGEARVAPDSAVVRVSAVHRAPGVAEALAGADSAAGAIAATAHRFTTPERVGSTSLQIWGDHDEQSRPSGFQARHSLVIHCPDIEAAGGLLTALADAVGDRLEIEGVSLEVSDQAAATVAAPRGGVRRRGRAGDPPGGARRRGARRRAGRGGGRWRRWRTGRRRQGDERPGVVPAGRERDRLLGDGDVPAPLGRPDHLGHEGRGQPDEGQTGPGSRVAAGGVDTLDGRTRAEPTADGAASLPQHPQGGPAPVLDELARRAVDPGDDLSTNVEPVPRERGQRILGEASAAGHGPCVSALGGPTARADGQHRLAVDDQLVGQVAHLALEADVAQHRWDGRGRARDERRQRGEPTRVHGTDSDVGVERRRRSS